MGYLVPGGSSPGDISWGTVSKQSDRSLSFIAPSFPAGTNATTLSRVYCEYQSGPSLCSGPTLVRRTTPCSGDVSIAGISSQTYFSSTVLELTAPGQAGPTALRIQARGTDQTRIEVIPPGGFYRLSMSNFLSARGGSIRAEVDGCLSSVVSFDVVETPPPSPCMIEISGLEERFENGPEHLFEAKIKNPNSTSNQIKWLPDGVIGGTYRYILNRLGPDAPTKQRVTRTASTTEGGCTPASASVTFIIEATSPSPPSPPIPPKAPPETPPTDTSPTDNGPDISILPDFLPGGSPGPSTGGNGGGGTPSGNPPTGCHACAPPPKGCSIHGGLKTKTPVHIIFGTKHFTHVDAGFDFPKGHFDFARHYISSERDQEGWLGRGWRFHYESTLEVFGDSILHTDGTHARHLFRREEDGTYSTSSLGAVLTTGTDPAFEIHYQAGSRETYSELGEIQSLVDRNGNTIRFEHHASGVVSKIIDPVGREVLFSEDGNGHIASMTLPDQTTWTYTYDGPGNLVSVTDPLGNQIRFGVDSEGRIDRITHADGTFRTNRYDELSRVIESVDEAGVAQTFAYFEDRTEITQPDGGVWKYFRTPEGRILSVEKPDGSSASFTYDEDFFVVAETDELGQTQSWAYGDDGKVESFQDEAGVTQASVVRDGPLGTSTQRINSDGSSASATFDAFGNLLTLTNEAGETTSSTYNSRGQVISTVGADGETTRYEYDAYGNLSRTIYPDGGTTQTEFDILSRPIRRVDRAGRIHQTEYLLHRYVSATVDPLGRRNETEYSSVYQPVVQRDSDGAETRTEYAILQGGVVPIRVTDALGNVTEYTYDNLGRVTQVQSPDGGIQTTVYDEQGRVVETVDSVGARTRTEYNLDGTVARTISPLGATTSYERDALGRVVRTIDALGNESRTEYNPRGWVVSQTSPDGAVTRFEHDALGRVVRTIDSLGGITQTVYDAQGRVAKTVDSLGRETHFEYDSLGRQVRTIDPAGGVSETEYGPGGEVTATIDPEGRRTEFLHDAYGRTIAVLGPSGERTETVYLANGNVGETRDALGHASRFTYDILDRVLATEDPLGGVVRTEYDSMGRRVALVDERGNRTQFEYDLGGRLVTIRDPLGREVHHEYDLEGRRIRSVNARGQEHTFSYDPLGRLLTKTTPEGTEAFLYDAVGRRTSSQNEVVTEISQYDLLGRMLGHFDSRGFSAFHEYDPAGQRTASLDSQSRRTQRSFDSLGRVASMTDPRGRIFTYRYDKTGRVLEETRPKGSSHYSYDASGRLIQIRHLDRRSREVLRLDYSYDLAGRRLEEVETRGRKQLRVSYQHDAKGQLLRAVADPGHLGRKWRGYQERQYQYDASGNRIRTIQDGQTTEFTFNALNQIEAMDGLPFSYDEDGNMLAEPLGPNRSRIYHFDSENKLVQTLVHVDPEPQGPSRGSRWDWGRKGKKDDHHWSRWGHRSPKSLGGLLWHLGKPIPWKGKWKKHRHPWKDWWKWFAPEQTTEYLYNADNLKVGVEKEIRVGQKSLRERLEDRFWDGGQVVEDSQVRLKPGRRKHRKQTKKRSYSFGPMGLLGEEHFWLDSDGEVQDEAKKDRFYLKDSLGSILATTNPKGKVKDRIGYSPFGEQVGGEELPFSYTGLRREVGGMLGASYRHYRPGLGRWTKRDPLGYPDGANNYLYVNNGPTGAVDPSGLKIRIPENPPEILKRALSVLLRADANEETNASDCHLRAELKERGKFLFIEGSNPRTAGGKLLQLLIEDSRTFDLDFGDNGGMKLPEFFRGPHNNAGKTTWKKAGKGRFSAASVSLREDLRELEVNHMNVLRVAKIIAHEFLHIRHLIEAQDLDHTNTLRWKKAVDNPPNISLSVDLKDVRYRLLEGGPYPPLYNAFLDNYVNFFIVADIFGE